MSELQQMSGGGEARRGPTQPLTPRELIGTLLLVLSTPDPYDTGLGTLQGLLKSSQS